jgi:hypothetical protein
MHHELLALIVIAIVSCSVMGAGKFEPNYDEQKIPPYTLPDPLAAPPDGSKIADAAMWQNVRRPQVLELFKEHVYGRAPGKPSTMRFVVTDEDRHALNDTAVRKQVTIYFTADDAGSRMDLLIYLPSKAAGPVPVFNTLNFHGNQSVIDDPAVRVSRGTDKYKPGERASRWAIPMILSRGYGLVTTYYGDIFPDRADGRAASVQVLFDKPSPDAPDSWGSIATWAWGLSRALDYLETDKDVDAKRVMVMGHSRLGKTALWAGASDERFAITISNDSGCGGAALSRRAIGETVGRINTSFPHWFCTNFKKYNENENALPVDQHELIALCAPRPVYVASAEEDRWADPRGEFLSTKFATPVYKLFNLPGMPADNMPPINQPVMGTIGYHIRAGKHDVTDFDWAAYLDFADKHLRD